MDQPVWKLASSNGALTFKEARLYVKENPPDVAWYKPLWSSSIPTTRSFLVWFLPHNRLLINENLWRQGYIVRTQTVVCVDVPKKPPFTYFLIVVPTVLQNRVLEIHPFCLWFLLYLRIIVLRWLMFLLLPLPTLFVTSRRCVIVLGLIIEC